MPAAEAAARQRVEEMPNFSEARNQLGVVLEQQGRLAEAEAEFSRALELVAENIGASYNLGNVYAQTGRPRHAETMYRRAIVLLPEFVDAHANLGIVLATMHRPAEAESSLRRALELDPAFAPARQHLDALLVRGARATGPGLARTPADAMVGSAVALLDQLRVGEAEQALRSALQAQPDHLEALVQLGRVLVDSGRIHDAELHYQRAIKLHPKSAELRFGRGTVLTTLRRLPEAQAAFDEALACDRDFPAARQNPDFVSREISRLSREDMRLRETVAATPGDASAQYRLGLALLGLGKFDDAARAFERALALDPDHAGAHRHLGVALFARGELDAAVERLARAVYLDPRCAPAMADLGAANLARGDLSESMKWTQQALAIEPRDRDANRVMAVLMMRSGRGAEATPYLDCASARPSVYVEYGADSDTARTVLILWNGPRGNIPNVEFLLPLTTNTRVNCVIESADASVPDDLPECDIVFNATGDPDLATLSAAPIVRFAGTCDRPLLNPPQQVARTARHELPALLAGIEDIVVPTVFRFERAEDWSESLDRELPLLVRPVYSHGGRDLVRLTTPDDLARARAAQASAVYLTRYVDFRSADAFYRKFRIVYIDREPYPVHLAISTHWIVHWANADMEAHAWKLAEERCFVEDPAAFLGDRAMAAIHAIGRRMDLDYAGIDFSLVEGSRVLVFEANPTMLVHSEAIGGMVDFRNRHVFAIQRRFDALLARLTAEARRS
jgi:tetratricopeptide (TPR) repeat protein